MTLSMMLPQRSDAQAARSKLSDLEKAKDTALTKLKNAKVRVTVQAAPRVTLREDYTGRMHPSYGAS